MRLLLVEDDADVAETLVAFLERDGFVVDLAPTLEIAQDAITDNAFDLIVLDRLLPDGDGVTLITYAERHKLPQRFLLLTALSDLDERLKGLELGADDYLAKPFEPRELLVRIRNVLRREIKVTSEIRQFGPLSFDVAGSAFFIDGVPLSLRRTEALVLEALMARPGVLVPRETLESRVYGYDKFVNANSLESQISRLRKNLSEKTSRVKIQAIRGVGYQLAEE
ncbi:response regulator transcription factor [Novosphingobium beihaiensis]|uniref:Response regulator transcription factor n=1 Tax=Novosphingobium beihaiensis TaxID=2930389 RepID=A0ABT0BL58_9SPHN|nr:response regulator transcription factor [Novosphingobium beihaiensis]MCJ2185800.1 response regulator transcription factor [Novosphingobium beihaiensis]